MTPMRDKFGKSKAEKEAEARKKQAQAVKPVKPVKKEATIPQGQTAMTKRPEPTDKDKQTINKIQDLMKKQKVKRLRDWMEN